MSVKLTRKITNEMMTTFLPSILLILITYATIFFKPFYFEAALTVNLTTMLVLTTIFIAIMDRLASTAYVKMIDIWLIFAQLIPFTEVVLLTLLESYREGHQLINNHGLERAVFSDSQRPRSNFDTPKETTPTRLIKSSAKLNDQIISTHGSPGKKENLLCYINSSKFQFSLIMLTFHFYRPYFLFYSKKILQGNVKYMEIPKHHLGLIYYKVCMSQFMMVKSHFYTWYPSTGDG